MLRRRDHYLFTCILNLDKLIEIDYHPVALAVSTLVCWRGTHNTRWSLVKPATVRIAHAGAGGEEKEKGKTKEQPLTRHYVTPSPLRAREKIVFNAM